MFSNMNIVSVVVGRYFFFLFHEDDGEKGRHRSDSAIAECTDRRAGEDNRATPRLYKD